MPDGKGSMSITMMMKKGNVSESTTTPCIPLGITAYSYPSRSRYASLFKLRRDDYKGWARGLRAAGYATDRRYPQKLISFIDRYQLYKYDKEVLAEGYPAQKARSSYDYKVHVVEKGDTLYSLSRKYYVPVDELMELNSMEDSTLSVGQKLKIKTEKK